MANGTHTAPDLALFAGHIRWFQAEREVLEEIMGRMQGKTGWGEISCMVESKCTEKDILCENGSLLREYTASTCKEEWSRTWSEGEKRNLETAINTIPPHSSSDNNIPLVDTWKSRAALICGYSKRDSLLDNDGNYRTYTWQNCYLQSQVDWSEVEHRMLRSIVLTVPLGDGGWVHRAERVSVVCEEMCRNEFGLLMRSYTADCCRIEWERMGRKGIQ